MNYFYITSNFTYFYTTLIFTYFTLPRDFKKGHMTWLESKIQVISSPNDSFYDSSKKIESISLDFILLESKTWVNLTRLWLTLTRNVSSQLSHNWLEFNSSLLKFDSGFKIFRVDSSHDSTHIYIQSVSQNFRPGFIFNRS